MTDRERLLALAHKIREGAKLTPQKATNGWYMDEDGNTCTVGAAFYYDMQQQGRNVLDEAVAIGKWWSSKRVGLDRIMVDTDALPLSDDIREQCLAGGGEWTLHGFITDLNDETDLTREQIADLVEYVAKEQR